jgi:hypothetical protein
MAEVDMRKRYGRPARPSQGPKENIANLYTHQTTEHFLITLISLTAEECEGMFDGNEIVKGLKFATPQMKSNFVKGYKDVIRQPLTQLLKDMVADILNQTDIKRASGDVFTKDDLCRILEILSKLQQLGHFGVIREHVAPGTPGETYINMLRNMVSVAGGAIDLYLRGNSTGVSRGAMGAQQLDAYDKIKNMIYNQMIKFMDCLYKRCMKAQINYVPEDPGLVKVRGYGPRSPHP